MNLDLMNPPSIVKRIIERYNSGYSVICIVCGKMRVGKTTKAYLLMNWLSWLLYKKEWDFKTGLILEVDELLNRLASSKDELMIIDEVQRMLERKDWAKPESRLFKKLITSQARKHFIIFLILPKASDLGTDHVSNINYVIWCRTRKQVMPYKIKSNMWDIDQDKKEHKKQFLSHFDLDIKDSVVMEVFKDELTRLDEFNNLINVNLKDNILQEEIDKKHKRTIGDWCKYCGSIHTKGNCPLKN